MSLNHSYPYHFFQMTPHDWVLGFMSRISRQEFVTNTWSGIKLFSPTDLTNHPSFTMSVMLSNSTPGCGRCSPQCRRVSGIFSRIFHNYETEECLGIRFVVRPPVGIVSHHVLLVWHAQPEWRALSAVNLNGKVVSRFLILREQLLFGASTPCLTLVNWNPDLCKFHPDDRVHLDLVVHGQIMKPMNKGGKF